LHRINSTEQSTCATETFKNGRSVVVVKVKGTPLGILEELLYPLGNAPCIDDGEDLVPALLDIYLAWLGGTFDPAAFNLEETNQRLRRLWRRASLDSRG